MKRELPVTCYPLRPRPSRLLANCQLPIAELRRPPLAADLFSHIPDAFNHHPDADSDQECCGYCAASHEQTLRPTGDLDSRQKCECTDTHRHRGDRGARSPLWNQSDRKDHDLR